MSVENEIDKTVDDVALDIDNINDNNLIFTNVEIPVWSDRRNMNEQDTPSTSFQHSNKLSNKLQCEEQSSGKSDSRVTPRRAQYSNSRAGTSRQKSSDYKANTRPCEQHTFLTDITEVRQMEQGLLKLLDDFHLGKLQAFGKGCTFDKMEQVREQQERLARVHFELNAQQEIYGPQSEDGRRVGRENLGKLIENLQQLSRSIEHLQTSNPILQTDV